MEYQGVSGMDMNIGNRKPGSRDEQVSRINDYSHQARGSTWQSSAIYST